MRKTTTLFLTLLFMLSFVGSVSAVDFQEQLQQMADENAKGYIGPFSTAFGTAMNSGLYHTAKVHSLLGFDISLKMMLVTVAPEALTYEFYLPDAMPVPVDPSLGIPNNEILIDLTGVYPNREVPTVFGSSDGGTVSPTGAEAAIETALMNEGMTQAQIDLLKQADPAQWNSMLNVLPSYTIAGVGFDMLPLAMPQFSLGLFKETEVLLRFFPKMELNPDIGDIGLLGIGVKHSISQWIPIPLFPLDISGQFVWQMLSIGDLLESKHTSFNIEVSKQLGIGVSLTPYVGLGMESSTLDVAYTIEGTGDPNLDGTDVGFSLDGDNGFRMTGGVRLGLLIGTLNVDYSMGEYSVISAGFGLTLR